MKNIYITPEVEIQFFMQEDIIMASGITTITSDDFEELAAAGIELE